MKLYSAGVYSSDFAEGTKNHSNFTPAMKYLWPEIYYRLESYHYIGKGLRTVNLIRANGGKVFLDSGAFSSFSLGVDVSIEAYADFIKVNQDIIEMASVLDAIGDPEGTYQNQQILESRGAEVLPCFHFGEPFDLCEYYVRNYDYITIGGMVPIPNNQLETWLDRLWDQVLTDKEGFSRIKIHGFGMTALKLMKKYPWYSVDSSSWVQMGVNGHILEPNRLVPITISGRSSLRHERGRHFSNLSHTEKKTVESILKKYAIEPEELAERTDARCVFNAHVYSKFARLLGDDHWRKPFSLKVQELF